MGGNRASEWKVGVAEVVAPVGLRGEVKVRLLTDFPDHFSRLSQVCLVWNDGRTQMAQLEKVRLQAAFAVVKFAEVDTRTQAEELRGCQIKIKEEMCEKLGEGHFYLFQVVGLEVVTQEGKSLGTVREVLRYPGNDVYATERFLIPATHEAVASLDAEAGKIVVRNENQVVPI